MAEEQKAILAEALGVQQKDPGISRTSDDRQVARRLTSCSDVKKRLCKPPSTSEGFAPTSTPDRFVSATERTPLERPRSNRRGPHILVNL